MAQSQRSPIFGIKLPCGSCVGFQKLENGDVVWRTSGPALDGQKKGDLDIAGLRVAFDKTYAWKPESQSDEWRFE